PWVAALVGLNLYLGTAERGTFTVPAGGSFSVAGEPSELSGAALSWARALGEFGATITFAGNLPGRTQTMPSAIYVTLETRPEGAIVLSLVLLVVSLAVLVALRGRLLGADEPAG
ncbi:MAG TPA: hypothetical protein VHF27_04340, partial [Acidimicrobiales bacterium]|nr:hypothetical protein [Acidimicrobiales bacterium]